MVTLLFTDLVASTELLARLGDDAAEEVRRTHFSLLRRAIAETGGGEVKTPGDGARGGFRFRPAGRLRLKGLPEPVAAVRVEWRTPADRTTEARPPPRREPSPRGPQLVGRDRELGVLKAELDRATAGEFRGVLLLGDG